MTITSKWRYLAFKQKHFPISVHVSHCVFSLNGLRLRGNIHMTQGRREPKNCTTEVHLSSIFKTYVPISQETQKPSITQANRLKLFKEIPVFWRTVRNTNIVRIKCFFFNTQAGNTQSKQCAWKLTFGYSTVHHQILMLCSLEYQNTMTNKGMNARGIVHGFRNPHVMIWSLTGP
jgi:hypothetical protein